MVGMQERGQAHGFAADNSPIPIPLRAAKPGACHRPTSALTYVRALDTVTEVVRSVSVPVASATAELVSGDIFV